MEHIVYFHSNPVPQRAHKKTFTGCKACKVRKVKCDEQKPVCRKCQIHFKNITSCDYGVPRSRKKRAPRVTTQIVTIKPIEPTPKEQPPGISIQELEASDTLSVVSQTDRTSICYTHSSSKPGCCNCPCHNAEYTKMLLDAVFGICRICGNLPSHLSNVSDCNPVMSDAVLRAGKIDPFSVLPLKSTPRVHALMHHWTTTLTVFPTKIHSQYCRNPTWLSAAISNPTLFNMTLYVASVHDAGLHGCRETVESLFYKAQTIRVLNEALRDPAHAVTDMTISAVLLLTVIVSILGDPSEVETHLNGLRQMINLRGGINSLGLAGAFLRMLGTTNHLTAVISESQALQPASSPYTPASYSSDALLLDTVCESPLLKPFALSSGFHSTVVEILYEMGCLYAVLNAYTSKLKPQIRQSFEDLVEGIEGMSMASEG